MIANYHTHTPLCQHASGNPREYVEYALKAGIQILGFSDHAPYPASCGYVSTLRMHESEVEYYVKELLLLREEYKGKIDIRIGYEMEYYPNEFEKMLAIVRKYPCDYLLLGQHFFSADEDGIYSGWYTENKKDLTQYVDLVIEGLQTQMFSCLAHPDLIQYRGDNDFYQQEIMRMLLTAKKENVPVEINLLGIRDHRHYPYEEFWKIVKQVGNKVILGSDAHSPDVVADQHSAEISKKIIGQLNLNPIDTLPFKKIQYETK